MTFICTTSRYWRDEDDRQDGPNSRRAGGTEGARVTELSEQLEMPSSTVHAHLSALKRHGFVRNEGDIYVLGLKFLYQ
ncbi:helix-turn-helix domain-containing protein [Halegenticoccus tardaugens]|uniref:helix-turn-helix domain-containing protein n=1 Tax=Halegenticoccus tardaugens TaxID=2071624 RepID=UPI001E4A4E88|nr:helix-turn-helix domain-containing protein [Halegenticoccus tardaugens]